MKKYVVCLECGRKLCKAEPGSVVEMYCPTCKKTVYAEVRDDTVVTTQQEQVLLHNFKRQQSNKRLIRESYPLLRNDRNVGEHLSQR